MLLVPFQKVAGRAVFLIAGQDGQGLAVQGIIVPAVFEFLPDPAAHLDLVVQCHSEISGR